MRIVFVRPPVSRKLREHGGIGERNNGNDGEGSPDILGGRNTHSISLIILAKKRAISPAKTKGDLMVRITRFLVREELSALGPDVTIAEDQYAIQKRLKVTRFHKKG